jgi:glycosyltransferase involved in cell wall biosynthesis
MRALFALPGFHRVFRGAEVALQSVARELAVSHGWTVTVAGTGPAVEGEPYEYVALPVVRRERLERLPSVPFFRNEYSYEEATFAPGLARWYRPSSFDVTVTCSYPFVNWVLRSGRRRPPHVFITQNGDWPALSNDSEFRFFGCDGLVCTNPLFFERNRERWCSELIPNGADTAQFVPGEGDRSAFGIPDRGRVVLMVSALITSKRVDAALRAVADIPDAVLVVAGDGPCRDELDALAARCMPGRFHRLSSDRMPELYRCADVFLHTTLHESFGNVYVEALSSGLPIVAHRSDTLEWILGDHGDLVDTAQHSELVVAIRRALDAPSPDDVRAERHRVAEERFDWAQVGAQYETFLRRVIDAGTRR